VLLDSKMVLDTFGSISRCDLISAALNLANFVVIINAFYVIHAMNFQGIFQSLTGSQYRRVTRIVEIEYRIFFPSHKCKLGSLRYSFGHCLPYE